MGSDADRPGFPIIRWKQTAEYGYVPNPKQPKVFMAVALDLPDNSSPFGSIHPRDKTDVADRLILGAREIAYNEKTYWTGPIADKIIVPKIYSGSVNITVTYKMSSLQSMGIEVRNKTGFQVCFTVANGLLGEPAFILLKFQNAYLMHLHKRAHAHQKSTQSLNK